MKVTSFWFLLIGLLFQGSVCLAQWTEGDFGEKCSTDVGEILFKMDFAFTGVWRVDPDHWEKIPEVDGWLGYELSNKIHKESPYLAFQWHVSHRPMQPKPTDHSTIELSVTDQFGSMVRRIGMLDNKEHTRDSLAFCYKGHGGKRRWFLRITYDEANFPGKYHYYELRFTHNDHELFIASHGLKITERKLRTGTQVKVATTPKHADSIRLVRQQLVHCSYEVAREHFQSELKAFLADKP